MDTITISKIININSNSELFKAKLVPIQDSDGQIVIVVFASTEPGRREGWRYIFRDVDGQAKIITPPNMKEYIGKQVIVYKNYLNPINENEIFRMKPIGFNFDLKPDSNIKTTRSMVTNPHFTPAGKFIIPPIWTCLSFDESILESRAIFVIERDGNFDHLLIAICNKNQFHLGIEYPLLKDGYCITTRELKLIKEWLESGNKKLTDYEYQSFGKLKEIPFILFKEKESVGTNDGRIIPPVCGIDELDNGPGVTNIKPTKVTRRNQREVVVPGERRRLWNRFKRARIQADLRKDRSARALEFDDL